MKRTTKLLLLGALSLALASTLAQAQTEGDTQAPAGAPPGPPPFGVVLQQILQKYDANTEGLPGLAQRYRINSLPTLVLFMGGMEIARTEGARPAVQIQRFVDQTVRLA